MEEVLFVVGTELHALVGAAARVLDEAPSVALDGGEEDTRDLERGEGEVVSVLLNPINT